jgi:hypothetical protein
MIYDDDYSEDVKNEAYHNFILYAAAIRFFKILGSLKIVKMNYLADFSLSDLILKNRINDHDV